MFSIFIARLAAAGLLLYPIGAIADDHRNSELIGMSVKSLLDLTVRDSAPQGWLLRKGERIGEIGASSMLTIKDVQTRQTILGDDTWVFVAPETDDSFLEEPLNRSSTPGWVYFGAGERSPNFQVIERRNEFPDVLGR